MIQGTVYTHFLQFPNIPKKKGHNVRLFFVVFRNVILYIIFNNVILAVTFFAVYKANQGLNNFSSKNCWTLLRTIRNN